MARSNRSQIEDACDGYEAEIKDLQDKLSKASNDIDSLKDDKDELLGQVHDLEAEIAERKKNAGANLT